MSSSSPPPPPPQTTNPNPNSNPNPKPLLTPGSWRVTSTGKVYRSGAKHYPNKDYYEGEFHNDVREGRGKLLYHSPDKNVRGNFYEGDFKGNVFHGYGVFTFAPFLLGGKMVTGKRYEGTWAKGQKSGHGVLYSGTNGDYYTGQFAYDQYNGVGELTKPNGTLYSGTFVNNKLKGSCEATYANGDKHKGSMTADKFHGPGTYTYAQNGGSYTGEYAHGLKHGKGTRLYANGTLYTGEFKDDFLQGEGIMEYINGDKYIGTWEDGVPSGRGISVMVCGDKYAGEFKNGVMCGKGKFTFNDGGYYDGEFITLTKAAKYLHDTIFPITNGLRNGFGIRVFVSGNRYTGQWLNNNMNGVGKFENALTGGSYSGNFTDNAKAGIGVESWGNKIGIKFKDPMQWWHPGEGYCRYEGGYKRNEFDGLGHFKALDNRGYNGAWKQGKRYGFGVAHLIKEGDKGDMLRRNVGGNSGLYRAAVYEGYWVDDVKHGHGKLIYLDGTEIEGEFKDGQLSGEGIYRYPPQGFGKKGFKEVDGRSVRKCKGGRWVRGSVVEWFDSWEEGGEKVKAIANVFAELVEDKELEELGANNKGFMEGIKGLLQK